MADVLPGQPRLYKFHGDLDAPETLVFTSSQYEARLADPENVFDIRLRSDLIGKRLLFLGYSLADENVQKLVREVGRIFEGRLPPSYLIAFDEDPSHARLSSELGITVIIPALIFPQAEDAAAAFEMVLKTICDRTVALQAQRQLSELFAPKVPQSFPTVTRHEVAAVTAAIEAESFQVASDAFRGAISSAAIPTSLVDDVLHGFLSLCDRANPADEDEVTTLKRAVFHLGPVDKVA
jgi:hypothetical protein